MASLGRGGFVVGGIRNRKNDDGTRRPCKSVKIDQAILDRASLVAAHRRISLSDYISMTLDQIVDTDLAEMAREVREDLERRSRKPDRPKDGEPPGESGAPGGPSGGSSGGPSSPSGEPRAGLSDDPHLHRRPPKRGRDDKPGGKARGI